jgi:trehalose 6-phosphate synthase
MAAGREKRPGGSVVQRIVVVSNRVPPPSGHPSAGGLAVALSAALQETGGLWFGWSGRISEDADQAIALARSGGFTLVSTDLTAAQHRGYYEGFANRTLWPLFHGRTDLASFDRSAFTAYHEVNASFAQCLAALLEPVDLIWVHDYHLMLLGQELRKRAVAGPIGFFLHIPFPAPDRLTGLPWAADLMRGLCAYDLLGFQTQNDLRNFQACVAQCLSGNVASDGTIFAVGRRLKAATFPVGIDTGRFAAMAASPEVQRLGERIKRCLAGQSAIIGVDRLDYTKGLIHRLHAFEMLLEAQPARRGRTLLLQIAAPSRETLPEYAELERRLEALSGRINARHSELDWTPVRYLHRTFSQRHLAALFRLSRVGLVTPLCDGMNLVAKEYVAAQDPDEPGVLVLSRLAGAAERLRGALLVDPYDMTGVAAALHIALAMPLAERRRRWRDMMAEITEHDVHDWRRRFLADLEAVAAGRAARGAERRWRLRLSAAPRSAVAHCGEGRFPKPKGASADSAALVLGES